MHGLVPEIKTDVCMYDAYNCILLLQHYNDFCRSCALRLVQQSWSQVSITAIQLQYEHSDTGHKASL